MAFGAIVVEAGRPKRTHPMTEDFRADFQGKNILVTGGMGFIGSNLAARLLEFGAPIRAKTPSYLAMNDRMA